MIRINREDASRALSKPSKSLKQMIEGVKAIHIRGEEEIFVSKAPDAPENNPSPAGDDVCNHSEAFNLSKQHVVKAISNYLTTFVEIDAELVHFEGKQAPTISIEEYIDRLIRYVNNWAGEKDSDDFASTGVSCALMAVEYVDRLNVPFSIRSVHRLYLCAVLIACKFLDDFKISNRFWAKVGGVEMMDLNRMELEFCKLLDWKFKISREDFESQQMRFGDSICF